jgi:hypothetical protein
LKNNLLDIHLPSYWSLWGWKSNRAFFKEVTCSAIRMASANPGTIPMKHIDRKAIFTNLEARIEYLQSFLDFSES